jgi:hypothetical protein
VTTDVDLDTPVAIGQPPRVVQLEEPTEEVAEEGAEAAAEGGETATAADASEAPSGGDEG